MKEVLAGGLPPVTFHEVVGGMETPIHVAKTLCEESSALRS
jgi:hypothetical protein